ncbi:MAG TPA: hypothetical protein VH740_19810 [Vicinamibacterales bacterium]|jgi:hypothetical protein
MGKHVLGPIGLIVALAPWLSGCVRDTPPAAVGLVASAPAPAVRPEAPLRVEAPPPPFSDGVFPCTECHVEKDLPTNKTRRQLVDAHDDIVLKHDEEHRWCLDCHDAGNRDRLHLASGEPVAFEESYRVCGQCHGEKYRDWRVGVHGRRIGQWNGAKEYLLCVHCHSPHQPRFKSLAPEPAPLPPRMRAAHE